MTDRWTDRLDKASFSPALKQKMMASRQTFLDEVKPAGPQLERGLGLHYASFVGDAQGSVPARCAVGIVAERLEADALAERRRLEAQGVAGAELENRVYQFKTKAKTLESAFDPQWQRWRRELNGLAGVNLTTQDVSGPDENTFESALEFALQTRLVHDLAEDVRLVTHADVLKRIIAANKTGMFMHMAGVGAFAEAEDPIRNIDLFYALGVRMMQMTYIQDNKLCASWLQGGDDGGLTELCRAAVRRMNELGIMVDIAHCGPRSAMDIIEASAEPILISHTACSAVYDDRENAYYLDLVLAQPYASGVPRPTKPVSARNASDEILKAVAARGGVAALYNIYCMLAPGDDWSFDAFARHIEHAVETAGADHVAIGADRTFFPGWQAHACEWSNWPYYTVGLVCRGFSDEDIRKIIGANLLRHAKRILSKRPWGAFPLEAG